MSQGEAYQQRVTRGCDQNKISIHGAMSGGHSIQDGIPETEEDLLQIVLNQPFNPTAHSNLGAAYWKQGQIENAINSLTRALELDPKNKDALLNCSAVFRSLGKEEDAQKVLRAYLSSYPNDPEVRPLLECPAKLTTSGERIDVADFLNEQGESQFGEGRLDRARVCFEMAIEADPGHWTAHCNLGVVRWEDGDVSAALDHLYTAMDLNPNDPEVLRNCFLVLRKTGHVETAAEVMQFYLQQGFGDEATWKDYGQLLREIGASSWTPEGLSDRVATTYVAMGSALFETGDSSGAITALERALKIDSRNAEAYYHLGRVVQEAGDVGAALELLKTGLELDPEHQATNLMMDELTNSRKYHETGAK
jgi:tetratricopeptide (TPR) repeat protein